MPSESQFSKAFRDDLKIAYGADVESVLIVDAPRSNKKPCDVITVFRGKMFAIEFKYIKGKSINFDRVSENQELSLSRLKRAGVRSLVIIWFYEYKKAVSFDIDVWKATKKLMNIEGRKSIKFEDIDGEIKNDEFVSIISREKVDGKTRWLVEEIIK